MIMNSTVACHPIAAPQVFVKAIICSQYIEYVFPVRESCTKFSKMLAQCTHSYYNLSQKDIGVMCLILQPSHPTRILDLKSRIYLHPT